MCEKSTTLEKKRRGYLVELKKILETREKKNTIKRLTMQHRFNRKTVQVKIPIPPSSQDDIQQ